MMKRFLIVFGLIILYMVVIALVFLSFILLLRENDGAMLVLALVMLVVSAGGLIPFMDWAAKRVFYFPGEGQPISEAALRAQVQAINELNVPVMVQERGRTLAVTWKYVDARWWELFARAGLTKIYELHVKFDEARRRVTLIDVTKSVSWRAGPTKVQIAWIGFRGISFEVEIGQQWGIVENFQLGQVYEYRFSPQEIKTPVMNSILRSGWDVRFGIW
jgi:hypothetical protein